MARCFLAIVTAVERVQGGSVFFYLVVFFPSTFSTAAEEKRVEFEV